MARVFDRSKRVGSQIQKDLAELIRDKLKDPRLSLLTISAVSVSRDFSYAKIYFRMMSELDAQQILAVTEVLKQASGFLRKELGATLSLRSIPRLQFEYDHAIDHGERLEKLINQAVSDDRKKQGQPGC